jgi:hypothetical protein
VQPRSRTASRHCGTGIGPDRDITGSWRELTSSARLCRPCRLAGPAHPAATAGFSIQGGEIPRETDCLLEGSGFEPPVPRRRTRICRLSDLRSLGPPSSYVGVWRRRGMASRGFPPPEVASHERKFAPGIVSLVSSLFQRCRYLQDGARADHLLCSPVPVQVGLA